MMTKPLKSPALHPEVTLTKSRGTKMVNHWMTDISGFGSLKQWRDPLSMDKQELWRVLLAESRKVSYESSGFFSKTVYSHLYHKSVY